MAIFKGRVRVRYGYSRWGYTRNNGKGWHGGSDEEGLDSTTIRMPDYKGKSISGRVVTARKVDRSTGSKTWEWGWYVCVELDAGQTPDAVNYLYFCHSADGTPYYAYTAEGHYENQVEAGLIDPNAEG